MAKANKEAAAAAIAEATAKADAAKAAKGTGDVTTPAPEGKKELNPAIPTDAELRRQETEAAKAADKAKAEAKAKKDEEAAAKKAEREKAKADRAAKLAELGATGPMSALGLAVKEGRYVKGLNGQLRSTNPLAEALDGVSPTDVIRIGLDLLGLEENPYAKLNPGQQSMNLRNKLRGAINAKEPKITIDDVKAYITRNGIHQRTAADIEAAAKAKAEAKAKRDAEAAAKKQAKAAEPATPAPANEAEAQAAA